MPADEVTHGTSVGESRARSGPRHAAPKKPLLTRLNMPAGKAIALAAMPTAVLMGMGFTPTTTLARAEDPAKLSLTADEYKDCVEALEGAEEGTDTSASPTPTPSASASESADSPDDEPKDEDTSSDDGSSDGSASDGSGSDDSASGDSSSDDSSSSDSGSDDKETAGDSTSTDTADTSAGDATATPSEAASESGSGNVLEDIGNAIEDVFTPDDEETESTTPSASTSPSPSPSASEDASGSDEDEDTGSDSSKDAQNTADDATDKVEDTAKDVTDTAGDTKDTAEDTADDATSTPSPSPSESTDTEGCPVATDDESGVEKGIPALPDDPWYLNASSLLLKGADYQGIVKVKTADGTVKEVLKYVISDGTDIGDLHQTVDDKQAGVTYHVQAGKGTTSTIRDGKTVMYTESISGNLLGLIPVTFDPKHPPPLNIPLIYFTKVKVVQAGQFGGTLTVPGLHQYTTD
ncbi:hypothetical protein [Streptomyces sp. NBC_00391]|uniref:hypothetical protein n=1 Tax=Streptomyces sp. NBC_00391 TaxID=2903647 RepID=UPI002E1F408F